MVEEIKCPNCGKTIVEEDGTSWYLSKMTCLCCYFCKMDLPVEFCLKVPINAKPGYNRLTDQVSKWWEIVLDSLQLSVHQFNTIHDMLSEEKDVEARVKCSTSAVVCGTAHQAAFELKRFYEKESK